MKKFLFSTANFPGYLDWGGLLETACLLQDYGQNVLWASGPEVASLLQKVKIELAIVPVVFNPRTNGAQKSTGESHLSKRYHLLSYFLDMLMDEELVAASCDAHLRLISTYSPDVIIADPAVLGAALAAEASNLFLASCGYPGGIFVVPSEPEMAPFVEMYYTRLDRLRKRIGLRKTDRRADPDLFFIAPDLHLVYTTPDWFKISDSRPSPGVQYFGGKSAAPRTPPPAWIDDLPTDRPLILVGRSTNYQSMPEAIRMVFEVIKGVGGYGLIGGSSEFRPAFEPLPDYIRWESWLPYEHLMPRMDAVMHHGGLGTSCMAIHHAVPQVIVPEVPDNYIHADSIARNGAGLAIYHDLSVPGLIRALNQVLEEPKYRISSVNLQERFAGLGGAPRAAEFLIR